ncbi:hypothetical protein [uncultured Winogradskyella sp.]|uniref:hypothetical protein n=1 Tax=uncultured Winogradskyella sp. TaxID=395353 RepID=UPI002611519F|nr:hypothetical protein [uncultured Winogradskyella sp.]
MGIKKRITNFINGEKETPLLAAFISGFMPMIFLYSNNYWAINSFGHLLVFILSFFGISFAIYLSVFYTMKALGKSKERLAQALLLMLLGFLFLFLLHSFFLSPKRGIALVVVTVFFGYLVWSEPRQNYKKLIIFLFIFSSLSFFRTLVHIYEDMKPDYWLKQKDDILSAKFKATPNIYLIQPDGYVSESVMEQPPYNFKSDLYDWLKTNEFKVYDSFRSNYPASLTSNASLFAMKQHRFANMLFPEIEMANAREVISQSNPVATILSKNNYKTHFIAEDEYFQQNKKQEAFDYFNIAIDDFPYNSKGDDEIRDVFYDFREVLNVDDSHPKFFFIEKLLPHHVGFGKTEASVIEERTNYLRRIKDVNLWLKEIINYISDRDKDGIIIILADHGGWVGLKSFNHLYSTEDSSLIKSTFGNIAAIKWSGYLTSNYDKDLRTNVNLFRVLFAVLSDNTKYLENLEDDSSYNVKLNSFGLKGVRKLIDDTGRVQF